MFEALLLGLEFPTKCVSGTIIWSKNIRIYQDKLITRQTVFSSQITDIAYRTPSRKILSLKMINSVWGNLMSMMPSKYRTY